MSQSGDFDIVPDLHSSVVLADGGVVKINGNLYRYIQGKWECIYARGEPAPRGQPPDEEGRR